jgi:hypothetical protein
MIVNHDRQHRVELAMRYGEQTIAAGIESLK